MYIIRKLKGTSSHFLTILMTLFFLNEWTTVYSFYNVATGLSLVDFVSLIQLGTVGTPALKFVPAPSESC